MREKLGGSYETGPVVVVLDRNMRACVGSVQAWFVGVRQVVILRHLLSCQATSWNNPTIGSNDP